MSEDRTPLARWRHVLSLLAVLGSCAGLYLAYLSRDRARLDLVKVSESVIADLASPDGATLQLTFDGGPIRRASVLAFRLANSGNVHLAPHPGTKDDDPRNPSFTISFPDPSCRVLSAMARPAGSDQNAALERVSDSTSNSLAYRIIVLNAGVSVQIDSVLADCGAPVSAVFTARGLGLKGRLLPSLEPRLSSWWEYALVAVLAVLLVAPFRPVARQVSPRLVRPGNIFSTLGAASYFVIWDFKTRDPDPDQRAQGFQALLLLVLFIAAFVVLVRIVSTLMWTF